ncbi:MAG: sulfur carrier protein ThiS, partial [Methyloversatilis sp.]|nr:sulfur carrier protein ThiS [Methyloversatilis sp.]
MSSITLNGEARALAPDTTVGALLAALDLAGKRVAVELNGCIVPRAQHAEMRLANG